MKLLKKYMSRADDRGTMVGLTNQGSWREVNYVTTQAGAVRGNHFHRETHELVFVVDGQVDVELQHVDRPQDDKKRVTLRSGEGIEIVPFTLHTMTYVTDTVQVSMLDRPFDPASPDLHTVDD